MDGTTWAQQGNPISGPTTALNAGPTGITAINTAACSAVRCLMGTASSGNIMTTGLLTVTVNTTSPYGTAPSLTGLAPGDPAVSYSPASEAANVTGALSCSTTADGTTIGVFPVSNCSGLTDSGFTVIYDYAHSSHTVVKASQTISFGALSDVTYGAPDFAVSATASSGLTVSFAAAGSCTVTGTTVHVTGAGTCTVTASQGGDSHYNAAAPVAQSFTIAKADQTISFAAIGDQIFGAADFGIDATATSGLPVSLAATGPCTLSSAVSPAQVHISGAGTCTITASQAGDGNHNPAPDVVRSFSVAAANQTITFAALPDRMFGDADFTVSATASSGLPVTFAAAGSCTVAGSTVHITGAGSCTITASQTGNANFNPAADVSRTFAIAKEKTATTYTGTTGSVLYGSTITLAGTLKTIGGAAVSGETLTLTLGSGAGAQTCTGTTNASGSASCTVTVHQAAGAQPTSASFAGDANYLASSGSGSVSVFTALSLSQSALAQATALLAGARRSDADRLKDVIRELTAALAPPLWIDGNHVDPRHGDQVFEKHQDAVDTLMDLQRHGSLSDSALQGIIDTVVHADRVLAETAVADAIAAGGDRRDIADAQRQLARASSDVARGRFDSAIGHYENAWEDALDSHTAAATSRPAAR